MRFLRAGFFLALKDSFKIPIQGKIMKKLTLILAVIIAMTQTLFASYEDALKLFEEKKYTESLKILGDELVVANDLVEGSANYKIRFLAAHNHWKLGNEKSVVSHFKRCMDIRKTSVDPYIDLALYQSEIGRLTDAEITVRKGLNVEKSAMLYYILGKVSLKRKNFWRAKELFEKANSIDPEMYISYHDLGIALMGLKKYGDANTAFSVALAIQPGSPVVLNNIGLSLERLGKYKESYSYFKKANSIDMENKVILGNMLRIKEKIK